MVEESSPSGDTALPCVHVSLLSRLRHTEKSKRPPLPRPRRRCCVFQAAHAMPYAAQRAGGGRKVRPNPPPGLLRARRCLWVPISRRWPAAARPDQAEGLTTFVIEQAGVGRRVEARIVELDQEIIAAPLERFDQWRQC